MTTPTQSLLASPRHGRHCSCSACAREDWTRITAPCGVHGPSCPAVYDPRPTVYVIEQTVTERYYFDPEQIRQDFGEALDAWTGSFDDFVISTFEEHDGSIFANHYFDSDANPSVGVEIIARYDDE